MTVPAVHAELAGVQAVTVVYGLIGLVPDLEVAGREEDPEEDENPRTEGACNDRQY
jgi:hypothetical protein